MFRFLAPISWPESKKPPNSITVLKAHRCDIALDVLTNSEWVVAMIEPRPKKALPVLLMLLEGIGERHIVPKHLAVAVEEIVH